MDTQTQWSVGYMKMTLSKDVVTMKGEAHDMAFAMSLTTGGDYPGLVGTYECCWH